KVYVQLPEAYRSLSRPSSAPSAKVEAINFDNFKKLSALYYKLDVISLNIYAVFKVLKHGANE
ncbi:hypothetical protein, partial [Clostridioides difficile]|uniref:hypothetical protein n=1 Tax=Clostridioides difficile TaxID=1496 RepID=UPI001A9A6114